MTLLAAFLLLLVSMGPAYAYVDPGSGAFLLQILAAAGVGALFYLRRVRSYLKGLIRPGRRDDDKKADEP
ncbi:MAG: hypothetical protein VYA27_06500 [Verrucomicrobiota bacterium]|nr:hypothetical protein [Verrucomicrobiota bacterium]